METSDCVSRIVPEVNHGCDGIARKIVRPVEWKGRSRIREKPARRGGSVEGSGWDAARQGDGDVATGPKEPLGSSYYNFNCAAIEAKTARSRDHSWAFVFLALCFMI